MIKSFGDMITQQIYKRKRVKGLSDDLQRDIQRKLEILEHVGSIDDLYIFPHSQIKKLGENSWSMKVNSKGAIKFEIEKNKFTNVQIRSFRE